MSEIPTEAEKVLWTVGMNLRYWGQVDNALRQKNKPLAQSLVFGAVNAMAQLERSRAVKDPNEVSSNDRQLDASKLFQMVQEKEVGLTTNALINELTKARGETPTGHFAGLGVERLGQLNALIQLASRQS